MPHIWGTHNNSQAILPVAIIPVDFEEKLQAGYLGRPPIFNALIDTGAQSTCISRAVAKRVNLSPIGTVPVQGISGAEYHNNYLFRVGFVNPKIRKPAVQGSVQVDTEITILPKEIQGPEFVAESTPFEVLLGMDIISMGSLIVQGNGTFTFSY